MIPKTEKVAKIIILIKTNKFYILEDSFTPLRFTKMKKANKMVMIKAIKKKLYLRLNKKKK